MTRKKRTLMRYRKGANKVSTIAIKEQQKLYQPGKSGAVSYIKMYTKMMRNVNEKR